MNEKLRLNKLGKPTKMHPLAFVVFVVDIDIAIAVLFRSRV